MTGSGAPDDTPEYFRAKDEWTTFWKRIREGLENGVDDDPVVDIQRLVQKYSFFPVLDAVEQYIENLPSNFERRWRDRHEARVRAEKERRRKLRNPYGAGRKPQRSDIVLLTVLLIVQKAMRLEGLTAVDACKKLVKPPSRREASRWPGLFLYRDPQSGPYYVKTATNLRDIYNDALARYRAGPESLRRNWNTQLETSLGLGAGGSPPPLGRVGKSNPKSTV
jgi:hypothetical protein